MKLLRRLSNRPEVRPASFAPPAGTCAADEAVHRPVGRQAVPALDVSSGWVNGRSASVQGRVVLYQLWTFGCFNCTNTLPYLRPLWHRYERDGLVMVGIHTPEFAREADPVAVTDAVERLGIGWPVLLDPAMSNWRAFGNRYWPRTIVTDRAGQPWFDHAGEGAYREMEVVIRHLLDIDPSTPWATNTHGVLQ